MPTPKPGVATRLVYEEGGREYPYWLYVPQKGDLAKPAPLILFLHGSGEREGGDLGPHEVGIGPAIAKEDQDFPFYVLFPQFGKTGSWLANRPDGERAMAILDQVMKDHPIDRKRTYLTGISMGGHGTWELAAAHAERWAAMAPVCGYLTGFTVNPEHVNNIKNLPCWCFHGDKDKSVPISQSRAMMKALWAAGAHPNYTEFAGVEHNCWDLTYANPQLYEWFLQHKLP